MALVFAIGLLALLLLIGMAFVGNAVNARKAAENNSARTQSRMLAMSAVSRAAASIMIYSHQYGLENEREIPIHFNHLYSFDKSENFTDGLLKKEKSSSLMLLPISGSGVSSTLAVAFNAPFVSTKDSSKWQGNWVFFRDGSGANGRIIGRAAWQVIGSSAQILAPVFMRGHLGDIDLADKNFKANERRWGREIDEVYLDSANTMYSKVGEVVAVADGKLPAVTDYEQIYKALNIGENAILQRWAEKWFFPDSNANSNVGEPSMIIAESFAQNGRSFMRFNISELCQGQYAREPGGKIEYESWDKAYKVSASSDPWYARIGIDTNGANKDLANSERAIIRLSTDAQLLDYDFDYEMVQSSKEDSDYSGLPLLRRIGNSQGTFAELGALRKQITANFNDYCDADSVPTSDVAADKWLTGMWNSNPQYEDGTAFVDPVYTGNELSPYLYELGMHFGIISSDDTTQDVLAVKQTEGDNAGKFLVQLQIKAAPILKLCNMYPFTLANTPFEKLHGYVDFGQMDVNFKFQKVILKDVTFKYTVEDTSDTPAVTTDKTFTCDVVLDQLNQNGASTENLDILTNLFIFKGRNWKRAGAAGTSGETDVQPMVFTENELDNKPYPVKYSQKADEDFWQKLVDEPAISGNTLAFTFDLNVQSLYDSDKKDWKNGVELVNVKPVTNDGSLDELLSALKGEANAKNPEVFKQPEKMNIQEIKISEIAYTPQRIVLTAKPKDAGTDEFGLDYVKAQDRLSWTFDPGNEKVLSLLATNTGTDSVFAGFALSGVRNYDPRQNLNKGDWFAPNADVVPLADFTLPEAKLNEAAAAADKQRAFFNFNSVNYIAADGSGDTNPKNQDGSVANKDWEDMEEPAYTGETKRISTAVIRNAPMMSPWEIGFIHRGVKWQTINIKSINNSAVSALLKDNTDDSGAPVWNNAGTSYTDGDGLILEQIKMTDQVRTYGKININLLHRGHQDYREEDKNIIQALFQGIKYGENPLSFITESTRNASGEFPAVTLGQKIDKGMAETIADNFLADTSRPKNYNRRTAFLDFTGSSDYNCLEKGFHSSIESIQLTDAAQEEIIGKTINLLDASTSSPNRIVVAVIAQSIRDVEGEQVRIAPASSGYLSGSIDSDGVATKGCSIGSFDMYEHGEDDTKNIYFDEITGEVKMIVTFRFDTSKQRLYIDKIDYL